MIQITNFDMILYILRKQLIIRWVYGIVLFKSVLLVERYYTYKSVVERFVSSIGCYFDISLLTTLKRCRYQPNIIVSNNIPRKH